MPIAAAASFSDTISACRAHPASASIATAAVKLVDKNDDATADSFLRSSGQGTVDQCSSVAAKEMEIDRKIKLERDVEFDI
jgi:hypothetical protein